jgi:serine/threonine protein kinase
MMTGSLPFCTNSIPELISKLQTQEPAPVVGNYHQDVINLLGQMLQKDPTNRISANDILKAKLIINSKNKMNGGNQLIPGTAPINQSFHSSLSQPSYLLDFPYEDENSQGVFHFISNLSISAFAKEIID